MNKSIEEIKEMISDYTEQEKIIFISWIKPFYDFNDYMLEKFNKTSDEVELESEWFSLEKLQKYLEEYTEQAKTEGSKTEYEFIIGISGKIYEEFANSYDYPKASELNSAMTKYTELMFKNEITNGRTTK